MASRPDEGGSGKGPSGSADPIGVTRPPANLEVWLREDPSPDALRAAFPAEWEAIMAEVTNLTAAHGLGAIAELNEATSHPVQVRGAASRRDRDRAAHAEIRRRMTQAALRQITTGIATGVTGRVRFNRFNGQLLQDTFFEHDLVRKPVSMSRFRWVWRVCWQRRFLMALVQPRGIYCFYSQELIDALRTMVGDAKCLEIAAGDGTLSRFLADEGVNIVATDDYSWSDRITFTDAVKKQDARKALIAHQPEVVLCSWPPAGNPFERDVFTTRSVHTYIVITSRHEFAAGDWDAYRNAEGWEMTERPDLARVVLPPEIENAVYVFRRTAS